MMLACIFEKSTTQPHIPPGSYKHPDILMLPMFVAGMKGFDDAHEHQHAGVLLSPSSVEDTHQLSLKYFGQHSLGLHSPVGYSNPIGSHWV